MRRTTLPLALALVGALFAAPGPEGGGAPEAARAENSVAKRKNKQRYLKVRRFKPKRGKTFVHPASEIRVRFNRPLDEATITPQSVRLFTLEGDVADYSYRLDKKGKRLILTPVRLLQPGADYRVLVQTPLASVEGRPLKRSKFAQFFTDPRFRPEPYIQQVQFSTLPTRLTIGRAFHGACRTAAGHFLLSGGQIEFIADTGESQQTSSVDLFDYRSRRIVTVGGQMQAPRAFHPSARVAGGAIIVGGWDGSDATASCDLFHDSTRTVTAGPSMIEKRDFHAATHLADGRVLVTGGLSYQPGGATWSDTAEIYDPATGEWRLTHGQPTRRRAGHQLTLLPDGRVVVTGGDPAGAAAGAIDFFDPVTETFESADNFSAFGRQNHALATVSEQGMLLIADGGSALVELFNPANDTFLGAGISSVVDRTYSTAAVLPDGKVLLAGGFDNTDPDDRLALRTLDLYVPTLGDTGRVIRVSAQLAEPRAGHSSHTLPDGGVIYVGGVGVAGPSSLSSIELFTPSDDDEEEQ